MSVLFFDVSSTEVKDQMSQTSGLSAFLCIFACVWVDAYSSFGGATWLPQKRGWRGGECRVGTCSVAYEYVIFGGWRKRTGCAFQGSVRGSLRGREACCHLVFASF